jgi:hypothetical protein
MLQVVRFNGDDAITNDPLRIHIQTGIHMFDIVQTSFCIWASINFTEVINQLLLIYLS